MSVAEALAALGRGERHAALLEGARLETGGGEAFGQEAILAHFARHPLDPSGATLIETGTGFAAVGPRSALFGDLYDGRVGRLWRLDPSAGETPELAVDVPFDPDLRQARQDVFARAEDHPGLPDADLQALLAAGRSLLARRAAEEAAPLRARGWLVRALAGADGVAGLFATHVIGDDPEGRTAGFVFAAALVRRDAGEAVLVRDDAGEARRRAGVWRPRLVP